MNKKTTKRDLLYNAARIRGEMASQNITVSEMVKLANLGAPTITKARYGRDVRISTLKKIADALKVPVAELM